MNLAVVLETLLDYSDQERRKWRRWIAADPSRMMLAFQTGGRFPTIGSLLDHVFLVERRHVARLQGAVPPDTTGCGPSDWEALFEYADLVRGDFRRCLSDLDERRASETITFTVQSGTFTMTRRRLAIHVAIHEIRHMAQIAYAARVAGHEPPGEHDFFYFEGL